MRFSQSMILPEPLESRRLLTAVAETGTGLRATYYNDVEPSPAADAIVVDQPVDLEEFGGLPVSPVGDPFTGVFEGFVVPDSSERYQFWVNRSGFLSMRITDPRDGTVLVDYKSKHGNLPRSGDPAGEADLVAGEPYVIQVWYTKVAGLDVYYDVSWETASAPRRTIPREQLFPLEGPDGPRVAEAYLNGTGWSDAVRRKLGTRPGGTAYGAAVQWHATEPLKLMWTEIDQVTLRFDRPVKVDAADLVVSGSSTGTYPVSAFQYDEETRVATWTLGRELSPTDRVTLRLNADPSSGGVTDATGTYALDGDFDSPGPAALPTGDGFPGGDMRLTSRLLQGDVDRSGAVNALDLGAVKLRLNTSITDAPRGVWSDYATYADVNADGKINALDLALVKQRLNTRLPSEPPPPAAAFIASVSPTPPSPTRELFGFAPILG